MILACFVVILLQLYFNVCIIVVLIFELYVVFTSLIYDCYILLYYFFYSRIIHVVIRCNLIKLFVNLRKKIINNNNNYYYYYYCYNLLLTVIMKQLKSIGPAYTTLINSPNESKYWSLENVLQSKFIITIDYCFILFAMITEQPTSSPPIYNIIYRNKW